MSLLATLRAKKQTVRAVTLTVATVATQACRQPPTVATVATVTAARPEKKPWVVNDPVATVAAPPNDLWPRLEAIANACCDHWRDSPERRAEMLADLRTMTPDWQRHWIEHLEASYGKPK
jgi:hypothetical protein